MCLIRTQSSPPASKPPKPLRKSSMKSMSKTMSSADSRTRTLQFSTVEVREYSRTLGDNPACKGGPPTQLDWDYIVASNTSLDEYEDTRKPLRPRIELALTPFMRRYIMHNDFGYSHEEITEACKGIQKIRRQRQRTKGMSVKVEKRVMALQKALRRLKNAFRRKKIHYGVGAVEKRRS